jgi:PHP family Zn ribbon phosphoesterase
LDCAGVKQPWNKLISQFGNEINVLIDAEITDIQKIVDKKIAKAIQSFRENKIIFHPGGGGKYGEIELP